MMPSEDSTDPVWCVVANVVTERAFGPRGAETRRGTKHFAAEAKVHIIDAFPGMCEAVVAIGHHRGSNRFAKLVMDIHHLENFRVKLAYSPTVLRLVEEHFSDGGSPWSEEDAIKLAAAFPLWQEL